MQYAKHMLKGGEILQRTDNTPTVTFSSSPLEEKIDRYLELLRQQLIAQAQLV
jgi:hypothetical protein